MKFARVLGFVQATTLFLGLANAALAQTATSSASKGGVGTSGALPGAGSTELTYLLFIGGVLLFVFGMLKLISSFRPE